MYPAQAHASDDVHALICGLWLRRSPSHLSVQGLGSDRTLLSAEGLDHSDPLTGGPKAGHPNDRGGLAHLAAPGRCRRDARAPRSVNTRKIPIDESTMVPPGTSSPWSVAINNPAVVEIAPTATAHSRDARNECETRAPAATGTTIRAAIKRSPTTRIPPTTRRAVSATRRRFNTSTGSPAARAVSSSRATASSSL